MLPGRSPRLQGLCIIHSPYFPSHLESSKAQPASQTCVHAHVYTCRHDNKGQGSLHEETCFGSHPPTPVPLLSSLGTPVQHCQKPVTSAFIRCPVSEGVVVTQQGGGLSWQSLSHSGARPSESEGISLWSLPPSLTCHFTCLFPHP